MAIEINGKIYRNLQEQVLKNKEDIEALQESTPVDPTVYATQEYVDNAIENLDLSDYATQEYVTEQIANIDVDLSGCLKTDGSNTPTNDISWNDNGLVELGFIELNEQALKPTADTDIWKDTSSNVHITRSLVADYGVNSGGLPITNVGTPSNNTDAATKAYVDSAIANAGGGGGGGGSTIPTLNGYSESIRCASGNYSGGDVQQDHNEGNWDWGPSVFGYFAEVGNLIFVQITNTNPPPIQGIQVASFMNRGVNYALLYGMVGSTVTVYTNNVTTNGVFAVPNTDLDGQMLLCFSKVV